IPMKTDSNLRRVNLCRVRSLNGAVGVGIGQRVAKPRKRRAAPSPISFSLPVGDKTSCRANATVRRYSKYWINALGETTTRWCGKERYTRCFRWLWYRSRRGEPTGSAERRFLSNGAQKVSRSPSQTGRQFLVFTLLARRLRKWRPNWKRARQETGPGVHAGARSKENSARDSPSPEPGPDRHGVGGDVRGLLEQRVHSGNIAATFEQYPRLLPGGDSKISAPGLRLFLFTRFDPSNSAAVLLNPGDSLSFDCEGAGCTIQHSQFGSGNRGRFSHKESARRFETAERQPGD